MAVFMVVKKVLLSHNVLTVAALVLGVIAGIFNDPTLNSAANVISDTTISLMKLISVPLLFLSIVSSSAHFTNFDQVRNLGLKIFKYTILTTLIAALVAEALYAVFSPILLKGSVGQAGELPGTAYGFFDTLLNMVPDNLAGVFLENNVMAAVVIAVALAIAILGIKPREKEVVFSFFVGMLNAIMRIVHIGLRFLPFAVWAFVTILTTEVMNNETESLFNAIGGLTITVIAANLIQGFIILPALLRLKKINPMHLFINVKEALMVAFFTRSSMATLPITMEHAIKNAQDLRRRGAIEFSFVHYY